MASLRNTVSGYMAGDFYRLDIFNRVLPTNERRGVEAFLAARYGITLP